ncbi:uncharacterized protein RCC_06369 [Ramularia collo-cygni]|uniref:Uncharacterized protein n=1 Tax=Ramularia collo-cygni TaxID=112498 RepID=A0A2D3VFD5_9PEZI|nr:uncharacterized protein RCC_06369 [Ramularia collo-cygni]CZT20509.1 uncharacterized protein RCC_06369 [Ramularia collo-cygni]
MAVPPMSCTLGGKFYACASGSRFVGCCTTNPCGTTSCSAGHLVATSFDPAAYDVFVDQQCSGGLFFTCSNISPPFWGCCKNNPCVNGQCSATDLAAAFLSSNPTDAAPFLALNDTVGLSTTPTASHSPSALSTQDSPVSTASKSPSHVGAIVGGAIAGFAVLAALTISLLWLLHRRRDVKVEKSARVIVQQPDNGCGSIEYTAGSSPCSPIVPPYPGSPEVPPPHLPRYMDKRHDTHISQELPGSPVGRELGSGQRSNPNR